jgi:cyclase
MTALSRFVVAGFAVIGANSFFAASANAQEPPPGGVYEGAAFEFQQIRENVWVAIGTGALTVMSNAGIIINEDDVLLVDSHVSPAAAAALLTELKGITGKPVRYVVNTHYHFDHAHGNQIYPPTVEIIGHEYAHEMLSAGASNVGRTYDRFIGSIPATIERLQAQLDTARAPATRENLERRIRIQENFKIATDAVEPTPPTVTMNERLTLYRGGREIRLQFFGRAHTGGDIVVYLPEEKVLLTGDLLGQGISYLGDAFVPDYVETLEQLKDLDFEVIIPGHGRPFSERERIDYFQAYLTDFWSQVAALHREGVPAREAASRIDMRAHSANYPSLRAIGVDIESVDRAYELLSGAAR